MDTGRVVVITGAGGGIGALLVKQFLSNGDTVLGTDNSDAALARLREDLGPEAALMTETADVSSEQDCARLAEVMRDGPGHVDVLVNCAGFFPITPFEDITAADWRKIIDINLTGSYLMVQALLPLMKDRGWGRIVNFGSASVFDGTKSQTHYVAAKAGVVGFTRSLAREVGPYGITTNVITPGLTVTDAVRDTFPPSLLEAQRKSRALGRDELPEDLLGPVLFLASDASGFITGQTLNVDGGKFMP
jgi:3-oxoacyl-[acyl-carrier protein] reductase